MGSQVLSMMVLKIECVPVVKEVSTRKLQEVLHIVTIRLVNPYTSSITLSSFIGSFSAAAEAGRALPVNLRVIDPVTDSVFSTDMCHHSMNMNQRIHDVRTRYVLGKDCRSRASAAVVHEAVSGIAKWLLPRITTAC